MRQALCAACSTPLPALSAATALHCCCVRRCSPPGTRCCSATACILLPRPAALAPALLPNFCCLIALPGAAAVTPGHYLFAWRGEGAAEAAAAALARPQSWPYVLPGQLAPGDVVPVVAAAWEGSRHVELAHVTAVERGDGHGVFMPHTLTGMPWLQQTAAAAAGQSGNVGRWCAAAAAWYQNCGRARSLLICLPSMPLPAVHTGAIVVDGVVASELTSVVPPALAGPTLQRCLAASLRCAARLLPTSTLEAAVRLVSGWVHGVADAALSAHTLLAVS